MLVRRLISSHLFYFEQGEIRMSDLYYTQSLNLAAYLMSKDFMPVGKRDSLKGVTIYFNKTDALHDAVREYNRNIELKKFITSFKDLKSYLNNK